MPLTRLPNSVRLRPIRKEQHFWEVFMRILPLRAAILLGCGAIMAMAVLLPFGRSAAAAAELNALIWCDHSDPASAAAFRGGQRRQGQRQGVRRHRRRPRHRRPVAARRLGRHGDRFDRRAARRREGPVRAAARGQAALRRSLPAGDDGRLDQGRRQALRRSPRSSATTPSATTRTRSTPPTCSRWPR